MRKIKQMLSQSFSNKEDILKLRFDLQKLKLLENVVRDNTNLIRRWEDEYVRIASVNWLAKVDEVTEEAGNIINIWERQIENKCFCQPSWILNSQRKIEHILFNINQLIEAQEGLVILFRSFEQRYCENLESRNKILTQILKVVKDENTSMIGVYGMLGVGKTTIIEELVRILKGEEFFHSIVKVDVEREITNIDMEKYIPTKIGLHMSDLENKERKTNLLYKRFEGGEQEKVEMNKILVILDDIRSVIDFGQVGISKKLKSCKVVLVSRCSDILQQMGVEVKILVDNLNMNEVQILFQRNIGYDLVNSLKSSFKDYELVENNLLMRCGGSPLMTSLLVRRLEEIDFFEWKDIADQLKSCSIVEVEKIRDIVDPILQSIEEFVGNAENKFYFLMCCLSQPGMSITVESLVRYGIGLGLFEDNSLHKALDQAQMWINKLQSLSLLQADEQEVQIWDFVQDISSSIQYQGDKYVLHVETDYGWPIRENYENKIVISLTSYENLKFLDGLELPKLLCLWFRGKQGTQSSHFAGNFFGGMQNLKVLHISFMKFVDLSKIQHLAKLTTLKLEHCEIKDMYGISKLVNLKVLSLLGSHIEVITREIGDLRNLKVLDLTCTSVGSRNGNFTTEFLHVLTSLPHLEELEITITANVVTSEMSFSNLQRFKIAIQGGYEKPTKDGFYSFTRSLIVKDIDQVYNLEIEGLKSLVRQSEYLLLKGIHHLAVVVPYLNKEEFAYMKCIEIVDCKNMRCVINNMLEPCLHFPKLKVLSLENLPNLYAIFYRSVDREVKENEEHFELSFLEKLKLRQLKEFRGLYGEEENFNRRYDGQLNQPLFNLAKGKFPFLRELHLESLNKIEELWYFPTSNESGTTFETFSSLHILIIKAMSNIKHVWNTNLYEGYALLGNLKHLTISLCNGLQSLFPPSFATALEKLESLQVDSCDQITEVIMMTGDEDNNAKKVIRFSKLRTLKLVKLPKILWFYGGNLELQFPSLNYLVLDTLYMMDMFTQPKDSRIQGSQAFFSKEIIFPSLDRVELLYTAEEIRYLIQDEHTATVFPKLRSLELKGVLNLDRIQSAFFRNLISMNISEMAQLETVFTNAEDTLDLQLFQAKWLKDLTVSCSENLEQLFEPDDRSVEQIAHDKAQFPSLETLKFFNVPRMNHISWNMLPNLRHLDISSSMIGLETLISDALVASGEVLQQLEYIKVCGSYTLKMVIDNKLEKGHELVKYGMTVFPRLKHMRLKALKLLTHFSKGTYETTWPSLETVEIYSCPKIQTFSLGDLVTPRLRHVEVNGVAVASVLACGLNAIIRSTYEDASHRVSKTEVETDKKIKRNEKNQQVSTIQVKNDTGYIINDDGYEWRKYGQKEMLASKHPRSYYRCCVKHNCQAKKHVRRSDEDPSIFIVSYKGIHTCEDRHDSIKFSTFDKSTETGKEESIIIKDLDLRSKKGISDSRFDSCSIKEIPPSTDRGKTSMQLGREMPELWYSDS